MLAPRRRRPGPARWRRSLARLVGRPGRGRRVVAGAAGGRRLGARPARTACRRAAGARGGRRRHRAARRPGRDGPGRRAWPTSGRRCGSSARSRSDPREVAAAVRRPGRARLELREVTGRGSTYATCGAGAGDRPTTTGSTCRSARGAARPVGCRPADDGDLAAVLSARGPARGGRARRTCGGAVPPRSGPRSGTRSPTGPPTSGRWCRRWSTATTRGSTRPWPTTSARPG